MKSLNRCDLLEQRDAFSWRVGSGREFHLHCCGSVYLRFNPNITAVGSRDPLCDAQAQSAALRRRTMGRVASVKPVKNTRKQCGWNARTGVGNREFGGAVIAP